MSDNSKRTTNNRVFNHGDSGKRICATPVDRCLYARLRRQDIQSSYAIHQFSAYARLKSYHDQRKLPDLRREPLEFPTFFLAKWFRGRRSRAACSRMIQALPTPIACSSPLMSDGLLRAAFHYFSRCSPSLALPSVPSFSVLSFLRLCVVIYQSACKQRCNGRRPRKLDGKSEEKSRVPQRLTIVGGSS